jgi:putative membrane protein
MIVLAKWFISALALLATAYLFPGIVVESFLTALLVAALFGILNTVVRPVLILLTLPITVVTLGLFILVLNGFLFWFVASFVERFSVDGFVTAMFGALTVSVFSWIGNRLLVAPPRSMHTRQVIHDGNL